MHDAVLSSVHACRRVAGACRWTARPSSLRRGWGGTGTETPTSPPRRATPLATHLAAARSHLSAFMHVLFGARGVSKNGGICSFANISRDYAHACSAFMQVTQHVALLSKWVAADLYAKELDLLQFELSMSRCSVDLWAAVEAIEAAHALVVGAKNFRFWVSVSIFLCFETFLMDLGTSSCCERVGHCVHACSGAEAAMPTGGSPDPPEPGHRVPQRAHDGGEQPPRAAIHQDTWFQWQHAWRPRSVRTHELRRACQHQRRARVCRARGGLQRAPLAMCRRVRVTCFLYLFFPHAACRIVAPLSNQAVHGSGHIPMFCEFCVATV